MFIFVFVAEATRDNRSNDGTRLVDPDSNLEITDWVVPTRVAS